MPNRRSLFQVISIGCTTVYLARGAIRKPLLHVEWFHRGRFLFGKWFDVSTAERQLTYPEDSPQDSNTYAEDSSAEDDINMKVSRGRAQFRYGGWW